MTAAQQRLLEAVSALVISLAEEAIKLPTANDKRLGVDILRAKQALMALNPVLAAR